MFARILLIGIIYFEPFSLAIAASPTSAKEFFVTDKVWTVHFTIPADEWKAMQAINRKGIAAVFGPKPKEKVAPDPERPKSVSPFGFEFPYGRVTMEMEGTTINNVGLRFKGNSSFATARGLKRPFKVDFDRYVQGQTACGLSTFNLSNNVMDPTQMRENLAYSTFRAAGTPASRTAYAKVYLTVPEEHDHVYLGLYTVVECVDKQFLKDHFGNNKGLLIKPEKAGTLAYLGEDWPRYRDQYNAKHEGAPEEGKRLIELVRLVNKGDDEEFNRRIMELVDVDSFLRLAAANSLLTNLDSFFGLGHNYYMYLNHATNKFTWIPWDLDHSFGALGMLGNVDQMMDWSIRKPYAGDNKLVRRLFAIPGIEEQFQTQIQRLIDGPFHPETMAATIEATQKVIQSAIDEEPKRSRSAFTPPSDKAAPKAGAAPSQRAPDLKTFVTKRVTSVRDQLAGRTDGQDIRGMSLFGGKPKPGLGRPLADIILAADLDKDGMLSPTEAEAAVRTWFERSVGDSKTANVVVITKDISRAAPPQAAPGTAPPRAIAEALLKKIAGASDGSLTIEAAIKALPELFNEWDKDGDGKLNREELYKGIDSLTAVPSTEK